MLNDVSRTWLVGGVWFATFAVIIACSVAMGATLSTSALMLMAGVAPAVVMVLTGFREPTLTGAEILHSANAKDGR